MIAGQSRIVNGAIKEHLLLGFVEGSVLGNWYFMLSPSVTGDRCQPRQRLPELADVLRPHFPGSAPRIAVVL